MVALTDTPRISCRYCGDPWPGATPWVCRCGKGSVTNTLRDIGRPLPSVRAALARLIERFAGWLGRLG